MVLWFRAVLPVTLSPSPKHWIPTIPVAGGELTMFVAKLNIK